MVDMEVDVVINEDYLVAADFIALYDAIFDICIDSSLRHERSQRRAQQVSLQTYTVARDTEHLFHQRYGLLLHHKANRSETC